MTERAKLIERLETAEAGSRELDACLYIEFCIPKERVGRIDVLGGIVGWWPKDAPYQSAIEVPHYTASIDAAVALVASQGFEWLKRSPRVFSAHRPLTEEQEARKEWGRHFEAVGVTPAIALCLALLKALEARDG